MSILSSLSEQEFNTQLEHWEEQLKLELKLPEIGQKNQKKTLEGFWPTLSLQARGQHLPVKESWKKAAQTYVEVSSQNIGTIIQDDLEAGVRNFFFEKDFLNEESWQKISQTFNRFEKSSEVEVFLLGPKEFKIEKPFFKVIDENEVAIGRTAHDNGANIIQELGLMAYCLIRKLDRPGDTVYLGVFTDSQFFKNIAKLRAAKLLAYKILEEAKISKSVSLIALNSFREWTLYERYSNMLRNDAAVAASYIAGADHVQSAGYQSLFELEGLGIDPEHSERSSRMARNTSHILALESMLGMVQDAAFGSYHLENLTEHYAEEAWKFMQELLPLSPVQPFVTEKALEVQAERLRAVKMRKHVMAGMNDFPDVKEVLNLKTDPTYRFFRLAHDFENLRLQMEKVKKPSVYVALYGDYAALNGRLNFVKNYFELLALTVGDPHHSQKDIKAFENELLSRHEEIIVLCAADSDYPELRSISQKLKKPDQFIAGKYEMPGFTNLFAGQNVYDVLEEIVKRWGKK